MFKEYEKCTLCPRECAVNRNELEKGICRATSEIMVGRADLHYWEEPCISGENGSGTVFFAGCSLNCVYCQNYGLSRGKKGRPVSVKELKEKFLELRDKGAHNINLVTGEHYAPGIREALLNAKKEGLDIPVVLNSSGYVKESTIELLSDVIDIYLVDFKYMDSSLAKKYSGAEDYPDVAKKALEKMVSLKDRLIFDNNEMLKEGVIVRHLCLPGFMEDSKAVLKYVFQKYGEKVKLSIMSQFTPMPECAKYPEINRKLTDQEYDCIIDYCVSIGIEDAYIQEGDAAQESFIPEFA